MARVRKRLSPTQRLGRWARRLAWVAGGFVALYTAVFFVWNDRLLGRSVSALASGAVRGGGPGGYALQIERGHYPYWGGLSSVLFDTPMYFDVWNASVTDVDGNEVMFVPHAHGAMYAREFLTALATSLLPGVPFHLELHFTDADVDHPRCAIAFDKEGEVNLVGAFLPKKPKPRGPAAGGLRVQLDSVRLHDADFQITMPGWHAEAHHIEAAAHLYASSHFAENPPGRVMLDYGVDRLAASDGKLVLGTGLPKPFVFPLTDVTATEFGASRPETEILRFDARARTLGAEGAVRGRLVDIYSGHPGVDLTIGFEHGAGLLALLPTGGLLAGDPRGDVRIHGPFSHVLLDGHADGGELHLLGLAGDHARAAFHLDGQELKLDDAHVAAAGGEVSAEVVIDFAKLLWRADLRVDKQTAIDPARLAPLVPPAARKVLAGRAGGTARVEGSLAVHPERVRVRALEVALDRRLRDRLPAHVEVSGRMRLSPERIDLDGVALRAAGATATANGTVDPRRATANADVVFDSPHLGQLLTRFGVPPDLGVGAVHAKAHLSGPLVEPTASGTLSASTVGAGERILPHATARVRLEQGTLTASEITAEGPFGGAVLGEISVGLFDGPFTRRRDDPTLSIHLAAPKLSLETISGTPHLQGELQGRLDVEGTFAHPMGAARVQAPALTFWGDAYRDGRLDIAVREDHYRIERLALERVHGGTVSGQGQVARDGSALDLDAQLSRFPLAAIPQLRDVPVPLAGTLSGSLHVGGDIHHWQPSGIVQAAAIKVREVLLGDGRLDLIAPPAAAAGVFPKIQLAGEFFRRFKVSGDLTLYPSVAVRVKIAFTDFPLEELIPELKKLAEVHGVASGVATVTYDVISNQTSADLVLSKLVLSLTGEDEDERGATRHTDEFRNDGDVIITSDGKKLTFQQAKMKGRIGEFAVAGDLSATASALHVKGQLELQLLEYFFSSVFTHTHGDATADLTIEGPAARPRVTGWLELQKALLEPRWAERGFACEGRVDFDPGRVRLHQLKARLDDAEAIAEASLRIDPDWTPQDVSARVEGTLSPTLLAWIFPDHIGEASGRMLVSARLAGRWPKPVWSGRIDVQNLAFHEKRLGRDVRIVEGTVMLDQYDLALGCPEGDYALLKDGRLAPPPAGCTPIRARVDETGDLRVDGVVSLPGLQLGRVAVRLVGDNLEWSSPGIYSLTVAPDVLLTGDGEHLKLTGTGGRPGQIVIVAGRYKQDFSYQDLIIRPRAVEADAPFYEGNPLLEQLELDLVASSSGSLHVKNNLADLNVSFQRLAISGVLEKPALDGAIYVEEGGHFQIPFLRADFISDRSQITFEPDRDFPDETPRLDIKAQSDWTDRWEQVHHLLLTINGTYKEPYLDLSSSDGWNRTQVLFAIATGGAPDDVRKSLQADPTRMAQQGGGRSGADPVLKTVSGQFISSLIEDPLKSIFRLDTARLELGSDSVQIRLCAYNTRYVKLCGNADVGFVLSSRYDVSGQFKLTDDLALSGAVEHIEHGVDTIEDILTRGKFQLVYKPRFH